MPDAAQEDLIAEVARDLVARTAPQELPLFRRMSAAYFADPDRAKVAAHPDDDRWASAPPRAWPS